MTDQLLNANGCECGHCVLAARRTVERRDALRATERRRDARTVNPTDVTPEARTRQPRAAQVAMRAREAVMETMRGRA